MLYRRKMQIMPARSSRAGLISSSFKVSLLFFSLLAPNLLLDVAEMAVNGVLVHFDFGT